MKSIIHSRLACRRLLLLALTFIVAAGSASAQHYVGVKGGYGAGHGRFYPKYEGLLSWRKYNGGVAWKYYSQDGWWSGVGAEVEYQTRGYSIYRGLTTDTRGKDTLQTRALHSITVPLIWQPHLYLARQRLRLFVNLGFTISYNLNAGGTLGVTTFETDNEGKILRQTGYWQNPYVMNTARDNSWNYGACGGVGFGVLVGRCEIFAEGRYYLGMSDIVRTKTRYIFNDIGSIRSELGNVFITVGVFFRVGKGGIAPPRKGRVAASRKDDFRNVKLGPMGY